ncbi:hypothetical protein [Dysosmobacter sp. Phy]
MGFERLHNTTKRIRRQAKSRVELGKSTRLKGGMGPTVPENEATRRMKRESLVLQ